MPGHGFIETHNVPLNFKGKKMLSQGEIKSCDSHTNTGYARFITLLANSKVDIQVKIVRINSDEEVLYEPLVKLDIKTSRC